MDQSSRGLFQISVMLMLKIHNKNAAMTLA
jgi:hypothetical protein